MSGSFLDYIKVVEDGRIAGMTTYPLDEVLLTILVGLLCRMEDFDEIAMFGEEQLDWLRRFLPFENGVAPAQTLRRALRALDPKALQGAFSSWVASLQAKVCDQSPGVVAIDGKTLRGSKRDKSGSGALHAVSAYAHEAGLLLAARAVIQRRGQVVLKMLANVQQTTIKPIIEAGVAKGALIHTDEYDIYARLLAWGYEHKTVCHGRGEYARDEDGDGFHEIHVNTIEGCCCVHGCDHIAASPKKSCRSTSRSSSSCTTPENVEKRC